MFELFVNATSSKFMTNRTTILDPIRIGYYDPFNVFPLCKDRLMEKFPLTNLNWKQRGVSLKSIPSLPIEFVEEVPKRTSLANVDTYLRMIFVRADTLDIYRSQVRPLIREWMRCSVQDANVEWIIIYFIPQSSKDKSSTIIKTSVFDKLKADFGNSGKELLEMTIDDNQWDRCFKLREIYEENQSRLEVYNNISFQIKELLISSFDRRYESLNNKLSNNKIVNAETFVNKLDLADLLTDMRLLKEALSIYKELNDELKCLISNQPSKFELNTIPHKESFNNYKILSPISIPQIKKYLLEQDSKKINLYELILFVFNKQSIILQALAYSASTVSISSIYICDLYRKLIYFLNDISSLLQVNVNELSFVLIDVYSRLPILEKISDDYHKLTTEEEQGNSLKGILEYQGELKMFQRSKLVKIAESLGYYINGINEILEEVSLEDSKPNIKSDIKLSYDPLLKILESKESYYSYFEKFTELIIQDFLNSDRLKSIDVLSIDLVLLNYQKGNYEKSLSILQNSFDFFINNGWNFIGGALLDIYLDCVKRNAIKDSELILVSNLKLLSVLSNKRIRYGVNNYKLIKDKDRIKSLFNSTKEVAKSIENIVEYPLIEIFDIDIFPYIKKCDDNTKDKYFVEVYLHHFLDIALEFDEIVIELQHESGEYVKFSEKNVSIPHNNDGKIKLFSDEFCLGYFTYSKLKLIVTEKLHIAYKFEQGSNANEGNDTVVRFDNNAMLHDTITTQNELETGKLCILSFPGSNSFWCEFLCPFSITLGSIEVLLRVHNNDVEKESVIIEISSMTEGVEITKDNSNFDIEVLDKDENHDITIPYSYFGNEKEIVFKAKIAYTMKGNKYYHTIYNSVDTILPISVSVQDIFKSSSLFSKFQVGTSNSRLPIRVNSTQLSPSNTNYTIISPAHSTCVFAFGEQVASYFYKINVDKGYSVKKSDVLDLKISYSCLKDECFKFLKSDLLRKLEMENLMDYWFLFYRYILQRVDFDYNSYAIYKIVRIINKKEIEEISKLLICNHVDGNENLKKCQAVINAFIKEDYLAEKKEDSFVMRNLLISVPVPTLKHLQLIEYLFERKNQYLVGVPIKITLTIKSSTMWSGVDQDDIVDDKEILAESSPQRKGKDTKKIGFQYVIQNDENWLISGFKKQSFEITPDHTCNHKFEFMFIPLIVGNLLLPKVSVRELSGNSILDVDYKNDLETLLVVPEINSITFSF